MKQNENRNTLFITLLIGLIMLASCYKIKKGDGSIITDTRVLSGFLQIKANGSEHIDVIPSSINKVEVTGYQNLVPSYETNITNNVLYLKVKDGYINVKNNNIKVKVYTSSLNEVQLHGSGKMNIGRIDNMNNLKTSLQGSGNITIASDILRQLTAEVNGSGEINATETIADSARAVVSGSGHVKLHATTYLNASVSGSGGVSYKGNPTLQKQVKGSGNVRKL